MKVFIVVAALFLGAATASAQCPNCRPNPQAATIQADKPVYVWVRRRAGLLGLRCRWVLVPVIPAKPVQVIGVIR